MWLEVNIMSMQQLRSDLWVDIFWDLFDKIGCDLGVNT